MLGEQALEKRRESGAKPHEPRGMESDTGLKSDAPAVSLVGRGLSCLSRFGATDRDSEVRAPQGHRFVPPMCCVGVQKGYRGEVFQELNELVVL